MILVFLILLNLMAIACIHVVEMTRLHHFWLSECCIPYGKYTTFCLPTLSVNGHLSCVHFLDIMNNASIIMEMQMSFGLMHLIFTEYMIGNELTGSFGNSSFKFLRCLYSLPQCLY